MARSDLYSDAWIKFARGKTHIRQARAKAKRFINNEPCQHVIELDADGLNNLHKIRLVKPVPVSIADSVSDAANNLRSALDIAARNTAVAAGVDNPRRAYFPFAGSAPELEVKIRERSRNIPEFFLNIIRAFKPHKGGNDILWAMNEICNTNKHRSLVHAIPQSQGLFIEKYRNIKGESSIATPNWDRRKNESVIAVVPITTDVEGKINVTIAIVFGDIEGIGRKPIGSVLNGMGGMVKDILDAFEAQARISGYV